ncbi:uncharacterized protein LOC128723854 [Anopheles nili]|uniref:uncharacterized protein LOC128723854 n=1 Tax=Anopheles nili TaxID=185578 RepID=UPI00237AF60A|nr:uncharacterized protein LOC128723854 [Anopheles nili]
MAGVWLLWVLLGHGLAVGWCFPDDPPKTHPRPLEALFRPGPKRLPPGSEPHPEASLLTGPVQQPLAFQHRRVEPGRPYRWHGADQSPVPAFQRALPAIDVGGVVASEDDLTSHEGPAQPDLLEFPPRSDPSDIDNDVGGDNPLLLAALGAINRRRGVATGEPEPGNHAVESIDLIRERLERIKQEEDIEIKSNLLMKLLTELPEGPLPIVYIEDAAGGVGGPSPGSQAPTGDSDGNDSDGEDDDADGDADAPEVTQQLTPNGGKRSGRYYRRYPWKRQNARSRTYDAEARYLCVPSRDDVFKLLVGLHENRIGNHQKTVNFCNRKRPAKAIFTNIRFLG